MKKSNSRKFKRYQRGIDENGYKKKLKNIYFFT